MAQGDLSVFQRLILRKETMQFINTHYKAIIAILTPVMGFLLPSLQAAATSHPHTAEGVICACILAAWANPSFRAPAPPVATPPSK